MAFSIEARVPFLDFRLVEFVVNLPENYKIRNGWNKWIMRQALKELLPEKIRKRRWKVRFTTPETAWMRKSQKEIETIFASPSFNKRPYFHTANIKKAFADFINGKNARSVKAKLILQGANLPVTSEAEKILFQRKIVSIPDFIANAAVLYVQQLSSGAALRHRHSI